MRNYDGDEEYQQYVRSYGGHRSEAGYIRYLEEIREDLESRLKALSKKTRDYLKWEDYQLTNNMVWIDSKNIRQKTKLNLPLDDMKIIIKTVFS